MVDEDLKEFAKRLVEVRKRLGFMQKDFAPELDVSLSFLYQVEAAKTKPGFHFFKNLIEKFKVNPQYLFTGKGDMFYDQEPEKSDEAYFGEFDSRVKKLLWHMEHFPLVKLAVLEFFARYIYDHKGAIEYDMQDNQAFKNINDIKDNDQE
jgi:transcriptional regulator with XRE-family HTH domain